MKYIAIKRNRMRMNVSSEQGLSSRFLLLKFVLAFIFFTGAYCVQGQIKMPDMVVPNDTWGIMDVNNLFGGAMQVNTHTELLDIDVQYLKKGMLFIVYDDDDVTSGVQPQIYMFLPASGVWDYSSPFDIPAADQNKTISTASLESSLVKVNLATGLEPGAAGPDLTNKEVVYYDTSDSKFYHYDESIPGWTEIAVGGGVSSSATVPSSPVEGDMYYNTTDKTMYYYNGSGWVEVGATATEADPVVAGVSGIVKSDGTTISAAVAGTDYLDPSAAAITDDNASNTTVYPTWVTANTGNLPQKVSSSNLTFNPGTGDLTSSGDVAVNGGDITTTATTGSLMNTNVTALSIGGEATTISFGAATGTGTTSINNALKTNGAVYANFREMTSRPSSDADWNDDDYIIILSVAGGGNIVLPNPANNAGRVLMIRNNSVEAGGSGTFTYITYIPINNASILASRSQTLISDGAKWYVVSAY